MDDTTNGLTNAPALARVGIGAAAGVSAAILDVTYGPTDAAPLVGWDALALVYLGLTWTLIWPLDSAKTARRASRHDATRAVSSVLLLVAAVASLVAVGAVLFGAAKSKGTAEALRVGFGVASVVVSWAMVHTVYTLRYATTYYSHAKAGIDFHQPNPPTYRDFAYLAFTIGMTYQVSGTTLTTKALRRTALAHALTSYLLGTAILAASVNLIAGLSH